MTLSHNMKAFAPHLGSTNNQCTTHMPPFNSMIYISEKAITRTIPKVWRMDKQNKANTNSSQVESRIREEGYVKWGIIMHRKMCCIIFERHGIFQPVQAVDHATTCFPETTLLEAIDITALPPLEMASRPENSLLDSHCSLLQYIITIQKRSLHGRPKNWRLSIAVMQSPIHFQDQNRPDDINFIGP